MSTIHPQFEAVPDIRCAEALSEFYTRGEDFKVWAPGDPEGINAFPPEPAKFKGAQIAYLLNDERSDLAVSRKLFMLNVTQRAGLGISASEIVSRYAETVGLARDVGINFTGNFGDVGNKYYKELLEAPLIKAREAKLITVASFMLFQSVDGERYYHGLIIPRKTFIDIPLIFREKSINLFRDMGEVAGSYTNESEVEDELDLIGSVKRNEGVNLSMGFVFAAIHLPPVDVVSSGLQAGLAVTKTGLSRKDRRVQEARDRRASRRNK